MTKRTSGVEVVWGKSANNDVIKSIYEILPWLICQSCKKKYLSYGSSTQSYHWIEITISMCLWFCGKMNFIMVGKLYETRLVPVKKKSKGNSHKLARIPLGTWWTWSCRYKQKLYPTRICFNWLSFYVLVLVTCVTYIWNTNTTLQIYAENPSSSIANTRTCGSISIGLEFAN